MVQSLTRKQEYCTQSRQKLADRLNRSRTTIVKKLQNLEVMGFIVSKKLSKRENSVKLSKKGVGLCVSLSITVQSSV